MNASVQSSGVTITSGEAVVSLLGSSRLHRAFRRFLSALKFAKPRGRPTACLPPPPSGVEKRNCCIIHRMQIWRTTRSPPGTSCMKARLVRPLCFVLTMLHQKSLASSSIWSVSFRPGCEFCVSECHQKGVKSSTEDKVFFLVCPFTSEGKTDGGKEFAIAQGTEKVYSLHFKLEDLSKYVTDRM